MTPIFLLVVLASLGTYAVRVGVMQQQTVNLGLRSAQAFHAARAGVAWAAYRAISGGVCGVDSMTMTESGSDGFVVETACSETVHTEGTDVVRVYVIDVLAQAGVYGGSEYVSRRLQVKVTDAP